MEAIFATLEHESPEFLKFLHDFNHQLWEDLKTVDTATVLVPTDMAVQAGLSLATSEEEFKTLQVEIAKLIGKYHLVTGKLFPYDKLEELKKVPGFQNFEFTKSELTNQKKIEGSVVTSIKENGNIAIFSIGTILNSSHLGKTSL